MLHPGATLAHPPHSPCFILRCCWATWRILGDLALFNITKAWRSNITDEGTHHKKVAKVIIRQSLGQPSLALFTSHLSYLKESQSLVPKWILTTKGPALPCLAATKWLPSTSSDPSLGLSSLRRKQTCQNYHFPISVTKMKSDLKGCSPSHTIIPRLALITFLAAKVLLIRS